MLKGGYAETATPVVKGLIAIGVWLVSNRNHCGFTLFELALHFIFITAIGIIKVTDPYFSHVIG